MVTKDTILIINGPNLNNIGKREPEIYGDKTMDYVFNAIKEMDLDYIYFQSNYEGAITDRLEQAKTEHQAGKIIGVILNAGAYTHTSLAITDCLAWIKIPVIEVHMSNILARASNSQTRADSLRNSSLIASHTLGVISGFGLDSYVLAVEALLRYKANTH